MYGWWKKCILVFLGMLFKSTEVDFGLIMWNTAYLKFINTLLSRIDVKVLTMVYTIKNK